MRSLNRIGTRSVMLPLSADDIVEFHAARLLLLIKFSGTAGRIDGLTKMAKMDFFARYPDFFAAARLASDSGANTADAIDVTSRHSVESAMVRHHYGPWDKRYYQVLSVLEAKGLVAITKEGRSYQIALTNLGNEKAQMLASRSSFVELVTRMKEIKTAFGSKSGNSIKNLIYELFDAEVAKRPRGEVIEP